MRTILLIATALTGLVATAPKARAQYYGWGYYQPYYPVPYGYYPGPYYAPPPTYNVPPPRIYRQRAASRLQRRIVPRRHRIAHQALVNPLLGPLPGLASPRRY